MLLSHNLPRTGTWLSSVIQCSWDNFEQVFTVFVPLITIVCGAGQVMAEQVLLGVMDSQVVVGEEFLLMFSAGMMIIHSWFMVSLLRTKILIY